MIEKRPTIVMAAAFVARLLPSETDVPVTPGMNPEEEKLLEAEEQHEVVEFTSISFAMSVLVLCLLLAYYLRSRRVTWLPEASAFLLVGMLCGAILKTTMQSAQLLDELVTGTVTPPVHDSLQPEHFFLDWTPCFSLRLHSYGLDVHSRVSLCTSAAGRARRRWRPTRPARRPRSRPCPAPRRARRARRCTASSG